MHRRILSLLVIGALAAVPSVLSAQISTGISLAGGLALPQGDSKQDTQSGYNAAVGLNIGAILLPVGFRLEGAYNGFKPKDGTLPAGATGSANIMSGTANATVGLGFPYIIGGLGYYRQKVEVKGGPFPVTDTQNAMGFNIGAGVRFPLGVMSTFVEARYHKMTGDKAKGADTSYLPITFGIQF
jgi:hypothetical protein